jgi:hypothetical protein
MHTRTHITARTRTHPAPSTARMRPAPPHGVSSASNSTPRAIHQGRFGLVYFTSSHYVLLIILREICHRDTPSASIRSQRTSIRTLHLCNCLGIFSRYLSLSSASCCLVLLGVRSSESGSPSLCLVPPTAGDDAAPSLLPLRRLIPAPSLLPESRLIASAALRASSSSSSNCR